MKATNFLIIPCIGAPADDYVKIYDALKEVGEMDYARHIRKNLQYVVGLTSDNNYVQIKIPEGKGDK